ncbi:MAG: hypothetical protein QW751_00735 [Candidatus Aenigmatarchaeota archaeon]
MKRLVLFLIVLLLLTVPVFAVEALTINWAVSDAKVRPGGQTTIQLTVSNPSLTETPQYIKLYITAGPYLTVSPSTIEIASLGPSASQTTALDVKISASAESTTSYITVRTTYYVSNLARDTTINIPIKIRRDPVLQIDNVNLSKPAEPGIITTLSFDIYNSGEGSARDMTVSIGQNSSVFSAVGSSDMFIPSIAPAERKRLDFPLFISSSATPGVYTVPLTISYYDETKSDLTTVQKFIGMEIDGKAQFIVAVDSVKDFFFGRKGTVSISISNSGSVRAEFLTVNASSPFGTKYMYIGSLDSDDTEIVSIPQDLTKATDKYYLDLELSWKDKFGNVYTETKRVELSPTSAPIQISYTAVLFIIIIVGIGYWFYKKRKK